MEWNMAAEFISAIIMLLLIVNSSGFQPDPSPRNRMFLISLYFTFSCMVLNIISVYTIINAAVIPLWINMVINTAFFAIYPLMPMLFIVYILLFIFEEAPAEHKSRLRFILIIMTISLTGYMIVTVMNLFNGLLFSFNADFVYVRGSLNQLPMYLAIFTIVITVIQALRERRYINHFFLQIISWFPILSLGILGVQFLFPSIALTGSAMMIATLAVYLNFQIKKIAEDNLTKLPNREMFTKTVENLVRRNRHGSILLVSLDDFKLVNDTYGRNLGDLFLLAIRDGLIDLFPNQRLFRYGGDEFALILHQEVQEPSLNLSASNFLPADGSVQHTVQQDPAKKIYDRFQNSWNVHNVQLKIKASIAVLSIPLADHSIQEKQAAYQHHTHTLDSFDPINLLDHTIRTAKNMGKGQIVVCNGAIQKAMRRRNRIIDRLSAGIATKSLFLHYQPIYNLEDGTLATAEALLRMHDDVLGDIGPSEFIPLAEEMGLINEIGTWVFEEVCQFLSRLREKSLPMASVSVNFSVHQLTDEHLLEKIITIIDRYQIPEKVLKLEITESMFIGSAYQDILGIMEPLIARGITFNLDDFGTGYSNLSYIINLPFESIKLDKTLLWDIETNVKMQQFVEKLVRAVSQMGAKIIVEGIETENHLSFLKKIQCDMVQGFMLSPPLTEAEFIRKIAELKG